MWWVWRFYKSSADALLAALIHGQLPWEHAPLWLEVEALVHLVSHKVSVESLAQKLGSARGEWRAPHCCPVSALHGLLGKKNPTELHHTSQDPMK